eukprot:TRINITY_DN28874_c0_g1_i2.p1 TRINITY_DN28874_c0_g1~~TRINITY_DN28874_c0_g1_i2.p1  ORF type:complete len:302 (-),score=75.57 TRINITY_DN28874_c0_g1_i2:886-1791(-)
MPLCFLLESTGVPAGALRLALRTWARTRVRVVEAWDADGSAGLELEDVKHQGEEVRLSEEVLRRWRLLTADDTLALLREGGCDWLGYLRADSYVRPHRLLTVLQRQEIHAPEGLPTNGAAEALAIYGKGLDLRGFGEVATDIHLGSQVLKPVDPLGGLYFTAASLRHMRQEAGFDAEEVIETVQLLAQYFFERDAFVIKERPFLTRKHLVELLFSASLRCVDKALPVQPLRDAEDAFLLGPAPFLLQRLHVHHLLGVGHAAAVMTLGGAEKDAEPALYRAVHCMHLQSVSDPGDILAPLMV